jgi:hypothetical protein
MGKSKLAAEQGSFARGFIPSQDAGSEASHRKGIT